MPKLKTIAKPMLFAAFAFSMISCARHSAMPESSWRLCNERTLDPAAVKYCY